MRALPTRRSRGRRRVALLLVAACGLWVAACSTSSSTTTVVKTTTAASSSPPSGPRHGDSGGRRPGSKAKRTPLLSSQDADALIQAAPSGSGFVIAPLAGGPTIVREAPETPHAWSTIKPVIAAAVLGERRAGELGQPDTPTATETDLIARAIENSDNEAAAQLFAELGDQRQATAALQRVVEKAGDRSTTVNEQVTVPGFSSYGQTSWRLPEEARFYRSLANGCLLGADDTATILRDMANVTDVGGASWGLPTAGISDLAFKAGWGPEEGSGYTALQYGVVGDAQHGGYVIGIVVESDSDSATAFGDASTLAGSLTDAIGGDHAAAGPPACE
jgi:hypothetical protein